MRTAKYWRERAEEARVELEGMKDPDARNMMLAVVKHCEELAKLMERLAARGVLPPSK